MKPKNLLSIILLAAMLALAACVSREPIEPTPVPLSETFRTALDNFIVASSKLNAATGQGVNHNNYQQFYAEAGGAYDLAMASWPDGFALEAQAEFADAMTGWRLIGYVWDVDISGRGYLLGSDPHSDEIIDYGGEQTVLGGLGSAQVLTNENIGVLMSLASDHFETGRDMILPLLP